MKKLLYISIFLLYVAGFSLSAQQLRFGKNKEFKVVQFTDIHWNNNMPNCSDTKATMQSVLNSEKPDVVILTGDVVSARPMKEGMLAIAKILEESKTPWAMILGNHDAEQEYTRREVFHLLEGLPYYIGENGWEELTGSGNFSLPVMSSTKSSTAAILYCVDSNDYPQNPKFGHYDWIHFDQINWFRNTGSDYAKKNNGISLPSLVFFHIPIPEFVEIVGKETTVGIKKEGVASPEINSGFFSSMLEQGGVMGAFVGHDHNNDYIGLHNDIALGFGRVTGTNAYGELERGARVIVMYEGQNKFDTWVRTPKGTEFKYYYPSGLSEIDEQTMEYLPAQQNVKAKEQGLDYTYYEGGHLRAVAHIATNAKEVKRGVVNNFSLAPAAARDSFAFEYRGFIDIKDRAIYRFYTNSDDGSQLFIDGKLIVDNDGSHNTKRVNGKVALEAGLHEIKVIYFENYMGELLEVGWSSRNIPEQLIPDRVLFRLEKD